MLTLFSSDYKCLGYDKDQDVWRFERKFLDNSLDYECIVVRRAKLVDKSSLQSTIYNSKGMSKTHKITLYT